jgi:hypothetical protein
MSQEFHFKEKCHVDDTCALKILLENPNILDSLRIDPCLDCSFFVGLSIFIFF